MTKLLWKTEKRRIKDLIPASYNPRQISEKQAKDLRKSLEKFDLVEIPAVDQDGTILAGHQRLAVLSSMGRGEEEIDVRVPNRKLTDAEAKEYNLRSNKNTGEWDMDKLFAMPKELLEEVGFDNNEIQKLIDGHTDAKDDDFDVDESLKKESNVKRGEIWQLGTHRLMCGDSTKKEDVEKLMDGKKAHLFLTDPPYGVSYTSKNIAVNGDKAPKTQGDNEIENDEKTIEEIKPVWLASAKNAFDNSDETASYYWFACQGGDQMMMMMMMMIGEAGWLVRHELIWVKSSMVFGRSDYHYQHEPIIYGWKRKHSHTWKSDRKQVSVLNFERPKRSEFHPTTKPIELVAYLLKNNTDLNDVVLDLFLGSGTTLLASEQTGRICYGMEIDEHYCQVIIDRWKKLTNQQAIKIN